MKKTVKQANALKIPLKIAEFIAAAVRVRAWGLLSISAVLWCVMVLLGIGSHYQSADYLIHPALGTTALLMIAGLVWLALLRAIPLAIETKGVVGFIIVAGLLMRLVFLPSAPILEIDYFRYLWDGIVVSHGLNPYAVSPEAATGGTHVPPQWKSLAEEHKQIVGNINYAPLRTIYPPVAQFFFWITTIAPVASKLLILRIILIGCEFATVLLLISLLKQVGQPPAWIALYWWNPLIIIELVNSAHMDAILLPFLIGAILLAVRNRVYLSSIALVCAVGVKIWPILLAPLLMLKHPPRQLLIAGIPATALLAFMAWPIVVGQLDGSSGFVAYAALWARNEALFSLIEQTLTVFVDIAGLDLLDPGRLARIVVALSVGTIALSLGIRSWHKPYGLVCSVVLITAALFLSSATGYPWYYAWVLPFLVVVRFRSLMLLTVLLPIYYLRFYFVEIGQVDVFDTYLVWVEFGPVLVLLWWELMHKDWTKKAPA